MLIPAVKSGSRWSCNWFVAARVAANVGRHGPRVCRVRRPRPAAAWFRVKSLVGLLSCYVSSSDFLESYLFINEENINYTSIGTNLRILLIVTLVLIATKKMFFRIF